MISKESLESHRLIDVFNHASPSLKDKAPMGDLSGLQGQLRSWKINALFNRNVFSLAPPPPFL